MSNKSNIEIALEVVTKKGKEVTFKEIWDAIVSENAYSDSQNAVELGRFYTQLSLDGRFVTVGNNTWDLRSRHTFEEAHIDMNDVYDDVEEESDEEKDEEEIAYEQQLDSNFGKDLESDEDKEDDEDEKSSDEY